MAANDGQKGMGLIMLILIGTVPTAYALNRTMHERDVSPIHRRLGEGAYGTVAATAKARRRRIRARRPWISCARAT